MKVVELRRSRLMKATGANALFEAKVERVSRTVGGKLRAWVDSYFGKTYRVDLEPLEVIRLFNLIQEEELSEILGEEDARSLVDALAVVESVYTFKEKNP